MIITLTSILDTLSLRISHLSGYVPEGAPDWLRDRIGDGGVIALILLGLLTAGALVWDAVKEVIKDKMTPWLLRDHHVPVLLSYAIASFISVAVACTWALLVIFLLAAATLFRVSRWRTLLATPALLACQVAFVAGIALLQVYVQTSKNAHTRYIVVMEFAQHSLGEDRLVDDLSSVYLETQRRVFRDLPTVRVVPEDSAALKTLPTQETEFPRVAERIKRLVGRSHFCPGVIISSTFDLNESGGLHVHSILRSVSGSNLISAGDPIDVESHKKVGQFLALQTALSLIRQVRTLDCNLVLTRPRSSFFEPLLTAQDETAAKLHILKAYDTFLREDDTKWASVADAVDQALRRGQTDDILVEQLLARYTPTPVAKGVLAAQRCANLGKVVVSCQ